MDSLKQKFTFSQPSLVGNSQDKSVNSKFNFGQYLQPQPPSLSIESRIPEKPVKPEKPEKQVLSKEELIKNYQQRRRQEYWCNVYQVKSFTEV